MNIHLRSLPKHRYGENSSKEKRITINLNFARKYATIFSYDFHFLTLCIYNFFFL